MKIRREIKIGFLVLVSLAGLIWGLNFLKGTNILLSGDTYYGVYSRVDGLNQGSPIYYKGFKVGSVREIKMHPTQQGLFLISFFINEPVQLNENTIAQIYSLDLMGSKGVQLIETPGTRLLKPGDTLRTSVMGDLVDQVSMEVLPLKEKTERLIVKLDSVLTDIGSVFSVENRKNLEYSIKGLHHTMANVALISEKLNHALDDNGSIGMSLSNLEAFSNALQMQRANLDIITANLAGFAVQLNQSDISGLMSSADSTLIVLNDLIEKATKGDGSLGMLLSDQSLYLNMQDATANLDRLLADIRHNPERYLHFSAVNFGRRIYVNTDESLAEEKGITFKVKVAQSNTPLEIRNTIVLDDKVVFEDYNGKSYVYTVGETRSYPEILKLNDRLLPIFPEANIIALKDGKPIRLKSALRKINIKN